MSLPKTSLLQLRQRRTCSDKSQLCHAPSHSLYFGRNGNIQACCYSRNAPLGTYPLHNIREIWLGTAIRQMRSSMRTDTLPKGCELCAAQIEADNHAGLLARSFDGLADAPWKRSLHRIKNALGARNFIPYPKQMEFELSSTCNLECVMCSGFFSSSIRRNREKAPPLPEVYDAAFVAQLQPFIPHLKEAKFLGGEPLLIDIYYDIWELFIRYNPDCRITITTNGTVLNEKVKRVLSQLNCQIVVSIDSLEKETYERIRVNAVYERVMSNVRYFMEANRSRNHKMSFTVCPMRQNWREIPAMIEFANREGILLHFNTVVNPASLSLKDLPAEDLAEAGELLGSSLEHYEGGGGWAGTHNRMALEGLSHQLDFWLQDKTVAEASDMRRWCRKYSEAEADGLTKVLLREIGWQTKDKPALLNENPTLLSFFGAISSIGWRLQRDMPDSQLDFRKEKMDSLFDAFMEKDAESRALILEMVIKAAAEEVLLNVGNLSPSELLQAIRQYLALSAA